MSKHRLPSPLLPPAKRLHSIASSQQHFVNHSDLVAPISALYDELILCIFSYLSWVDLCAAQATSKNWSRLAVDNQLWKSLYLREYGRSRLRGARGFIVRSDGKEIKPLPSRLKTENVNWKFMFRISSNWRTGRCSVTQLDDLVEQSETFTSGDIDDTEHDDDTTHILLAGSLTITASSQPTLTPVVNVRAPPLQERSLTWEAGRQTPTHITALAPDQSPPGSNHVMRMVSFLATGEFSGFSIDHSKLSASRRIFTYKPISRNARTSPIIQAAYHHPLLISLSQSFQLSIYDLSSDKVTHTQTLSSFTSFPPTSLVLSITSSTTYKLVLAYAVPVYPHHYTVGATELIIAGPAVPTDSLTAPSSSGSDMHVVSTRTTRALDVPSGWIDENKLKLMREQWSRRVTRVADTQTDGKWVVLAPGEATHPSPTLPTSVVSSPGESRDRSSTSDFVSSSLHSSTGLQLYRLSLPPPRQNAWLSSALPIPKLTFVRTLHGQTGPISALALADGRCVSLGVNGSIWVWDLENDTGACVEDSSTLEDSGNSQFGASSMTRRTVAFDERQIVTTEANGVVMIRRFDV